MVEQPDIDQGQGLFEGLGKDPVRLTGFRVTAGVIMHRDDGPAVEQQGPLDHFPRVDAGTVEGAAKQFLKGQHAMLGVEEQCTKHFMLPVLQQGLQPLGSLGGTGNGSAFG